MKSFVLLFLLFWHREFNDYSTKAKKNTRAHTQQTKLNICVFPFSFKLISTRSKFVKTKNAKASRALVCILYKHYDTRTYNKTPRYTIHDIRYTMHISTRIYFEKHRNLIEFKLVLFTQKLDNVREMPYIQNEYKQKWTDANRRVWTSAVNSCIACKVN